MSILKSAFLALFVAFGSLSMVAVTATPAEAALTAQEQALVDLAQQRQAQLAAQIAPFQAIIDSPTATAQQKNVARAAIQQARFRSLLMGSLITRAQSQTLPSFLVVALTRSLTLEVSNNTTLVPV